MGRIDGYLTENEEVQLQWKGALEPDERTDVQNLKNQLGIGTIGNATFVATNRRLIFLNSDGQFKDIANSHISSVEVDKSDEPDLTPIQWVAMFGLLTAGAGLLGFLGLLAIGFGASLLSFVIGGAMFGIAWTIVDTPSEIFDVAEKTIYEVKIITGDETDQQIKFETEENIGANLSRIVREYS